MTKIFLSKKDIGEALSLPPDAARLALAKKGVQPIDFGCGRGRGPRWYAQAVQQAAAEMHSEAQKKTKPNKLPRQQADPISGKTTAQIYAELTSGHPVQ